MRAKQLVDTSILHSARLTRQSNNFQMRCCGRCIAQLQRRMPICALRLRISVVLPSSLRSQHPATTVPSARCSKRCECECSNDAEQTTAHQQHHRSLCCRSRHADQSCRSWTRLRDLTDRAQRVCEMQKAGEQLAAIPCRADAIARSCGRCELPLHKQNWLQHLDSSQRHARSRCANERVRMSNLP